MIKSIVLPKQHTAEEDIAETAVIECAAGHFLLILTEKKRHIVDTNGGIPLIGTVIIYKAERVG